MLKLKQKFKKSFFLLLLTDIALFIASYAGAYLLRFDLRFPRSEYLLFRRTLIPIVVLKVFIFYYLGIYRGMCRYTGLEDLENIIRASLASLLSITTFAAITVRISGFPRSAFLIDALLTIFLIGGFRLAIRLYFTYRKKGEFPFYLWGKSIDGGKKKKRVLIIGAGGAGEKILREIKDNKELMHYEAVGFLDDNPQTIHQSIHGVKVLDRIEGVAAAVEGLSIDEIIIAIPSAPEAEMRRIIDLCQKTGVNCKTIPSIGELINDKVSISKIRDVSYADLLGRSQVDLDMNLIGEYLKGKCVLVTGAGGSIGSEFCRQVAAFKPKTLIMLDRAESNLYDIEMELRDCYPRQRLAPILGSVTTATFIRGVFNQFKPHVVFHAAAYKHVPMMEIYPWEAMYNNILGTKNVLEAALEVKAERFVLISTDKAVRPTNVMGASKRVAEILLQLKHKETMARLRKGKGIGDSGKATRIMAVRFGNVIGSAGSVIPLFKRQIAQGGPVNVTHPDVTRFFMTIGEAVQLVLQAGAMGESGEIYILKMGRPVKILDMARDLIRLSGFEPDKDIRINITGLRPGEKLYEELITEGEGIVPTAHEKLMVLRSDGTGAENGMSYRDMEERIEELLTLARKCDRRGIQLKLWEIVPEYKPQLLGDDMPVQDEQTAEARKCMAVKM
jgi:FlaA1/EpsC-like NDP-sugar epimerase